MRRYACNFTAAVSTTANTATYALGLITAASKPAHVYEVIVACNNAVVDAQLYADLQSVSAMTAGTAQTPQALEFGTGGTGAAVTTASTTPTAVTLTSALTATLTVPVLRLAFNSRATIRWAAVDPDSRIVVPAGGAANGSLVFYNAQPGTVAALLVQHELFFAE